MDPHFPEYLAAIAGMHDVYGEAADDRPTEFHEVSPPVDVVVVTPVATPVESGSQIHWDCEPSEEFAGSGTGVV